MKKIKRFLNYLFIIIGLVLFTSNCKKDKKDKNDPIIIWSNPADISFGTLLSATQLNATSNVPGTFIYTPELGSKLNMGINQDLKVDFIPTDGGSYNSSSKTVKINVTKAVITFNSNLTYGSLTDIDGNVYKTIKIGTQTWMAENLRTTKYSNGDVVPLVTDNTTWGHLLSGAYCNYKNTNDIDSVAIFGRLYNFSAVTDIRNIAPTGWHVPSDSEWSILKNYLGNSIENHKLKEASLAHWTYFNNDDNSSGFTAIPCGFRYEDTGTFPYIENQASWLSTTNFSSTTSCIVWFYDGTSLVGIGPASSKAGCSVRCIKD